MSFHLIKREGNLKKRLLGEFDRLNTKVGTELPKKKKKGKDGKLKNGLSCIGFFFI